MSEDAEHQIVGEVGNRPVELSRPMLTAELDGIDDPVIRHM